MSTDVSCSHPVLLVEGVSVEEGRTHFADNTLKNLQQFLLVNCVEACLHVDLDKIQWWPG